MCGNYSVRRQDIKAFKCDRCKKYGPSAAKETLKGGQIVKEAFRLSRPPKMEVDVVTGDIVGGMLAYRSRILYVDKIDLCIACAASLVEPLKNWWAEGQPQPSDQDPVEFDDLLDSFDDLVKLGEFNQSVGLIDESNN